MSKSTTAARLDLHHLVRAVALMTFGIICFAIASPADAQSSMLPRRRAPTSASVTPRFSPYLGLLRTDGGPLPNYFQFVRPQTELLGTLQRQDRAIARERQRILSVDRRIDTIERQGSARPTGVYGGFMRYSHFYPQLR